MEKEPLSEEGQRELSVAIGRKKVRRAAAIPVILGLSGTF
jgi:hypothetical protein